MPRGYLPTLLIGIVIVCAACLAARWTGLAQNAHISLPAATTSSSSSADPAATQATSSTGPPPTSTAPPDIPALAPADAAAAPQMDEQPASSAGDGDPAAAQAGIPPTVPVAAQSLADLPTPRPATEHGGHGTTAKPKPARVDINRASLVQLQALPGVGPVLAQRIVDYRQAHGAFKTVADLNNVKGVGPKKLAKLSPWAYIGQAH